MSFQKQSLCYHFIILIKNQNSKYNDHILSITFHIRFDFEHMNVSVDSNYLRK